MGDEWPLGGAVVLVPLLYFLDRTDMEADTSQPGTAMSIVDSVGPPAELYMVLKEYCTVRWVRVSRA